MKKIILKSGKEVKIGDKISLEEELKVDENFSITTKVDFILEEDDLEALQKGGFINIQEINEMFSHVKNWEDYIKALYKKIPQANEVYKNFPFLVVSALLKLIAIDMDKSYSDHISKSDRIFCVNLLNGKISELDKRVIKTYKSFAAFRTIKEASTAMNIVLNIMNYHFHNTECFKEFINKDGI